MLKVFLLSTIFVVLYSCSPYPVGGKCEIKDINYCIEYWASDSGREDCYTTIYYTDAPNRSHSAGYCPRTENLEKICQAVGGTLVTFHYKGSVMPSSPNVKCIDFSQYRKNK